MHDFLQTHNVIVVSELLEHSNFANSCTWNTVITVINFDFFDCDCGTSSSFDSFVDDTIGTLTKLRLIVKAAFEFVWGLNRAVVDASSAPCWLLWLFQLLCIFGLRLCVVSCCWKLLLNCKCGLSGLHRQLTFDH